MSFRRDSVKLLRSRAEDQISFFCQNQRIRITQSYIFTADPTGNYVGIFPYVSRIHFWIRIKGLEIVSLILFELH